MSANAKNDLFELLQHLGCWESMARFSSSYHQASGGFSATVQVDFPDGRRVEGWGMASKKTQSEINAAQDALDTLVLHHPDLKINWDEVFVEAQAGDALIKLGVYLDARLPTAAEKSYLLQRLETDAHLVRIFDQLQADGDPDVAIFGENLGEKRKATWVEALIWRRYGKQMLHPGWEAAYQGIMDMLTPQE